MLKASDLPAELRARMGIPEARSKYNVGRKDTRTASGITFDSKAEMHHFRQLCLMRDQGLISYFLRQVPLHLPGNIRYLVDFMVVFPDNRIEYRDVKGMRTATYKIKRRLVEATYPVKIVEIK